MHDKYGQRHCFPILSAGAHASNCVRQAHTRRAVVVAGVREQKEEEKKEEETSSPSLSSPPSQRENIYSSTQEHLDSAGTRNLKQRRKSKPETLESLHLKPSYSPSAQAILYIVQSRIMPITCKACAIRAYSLCQSLMSNPTLQNPQEPKSRNRKLQATEGQASGLRMVRRTFTRWRPAKHILYPGAFGVWVRGGL